MLTSSQCRAARGLLDWSQQRLADAAGVGIVTVRQFEAGRGEPRRATLTVIEQALTAAGVEFTNGNQRGVRLRQIPEAERVASDAEAKSIDQKRGRLRMRQKKRALNTKTKSTK